MKLIANDTVRISSAGGRLEAGQEFEVSEHEAQELIRRGIARKSPESTKVEKAEDTAGQPQKTAKTSAKRGKK